MNKTVFSSVLQCFFCEYLINQKNVSHCTVLSYRDTFKEFIKYSADKLKKIPSNILIEDINAELILKFLDYLDCVRGNSTGTRNVRLAAIRSFIKYATYKYPEYLADFRAILAIPLKRYNKTLVGFLSREEVQCILKAPDLSTKSGRRDRILFMVMYNTGARVSELTAAKVVDVDFQRTRSIKLHGKGRKERIVPLWNDTLKLLKEWLKDASLTEKSPLFPNRAGDHMSRSGVEDRLKTCLKIAGEKCLSLQKRKISPHVFRNPTFYEIQTFCKKLQEICAFH